MQKNSCASLLLAAAILGGCGGGDGGSPSLDTQSSLHAPAGLAYSDASIVYVQNQAIAANRPNVAGSSSMRYSVAPALPAGLEIDPQSGFITGVPSAVTAAAHYTVTATNPAGSATARVQIEVKAEAVAPEQLRYQDESVVYEAGTSIPPNAPRNLGGEITFYEISPALPAGLALHRGTGVISGTPRAAAAPVSYVVTGSNAKGSVSVSLRIEVSERVVAPVSLQYGAASVVYSQGQAIAENVPQSTGGKITAYSVTPALPAGLSLHPSTGVISGTPARAQGESVHTVLGKNAAGSVSATVRIAVAATGRWETAGSRLQGPQRTTATLLPDGKVLVVGGVVSVPGPGSTRAGHQAGIFPPQSLINTADVYDPATRQWTSAGEVATMRTHHTATLLPNGLVLLVGGWIGPSATLYDPGTGTFNTISGNKIYEPHTATLLPNGKVLVIGNVDKLNGEGDGNVTMAELYDPATGTWSQAAAIDQADPGYRSHRKHTATLLPDGRVLVMLGANARLYDPATDTWTKTAGPTAEHSMHTATLLPNGKVLIVGNGGTQTELYDPASGQWASGGTLPDPVGEHAAVLLPNGNVLIAGGRRSVLNLLARDDNSAFLYEPDSATWIQASSMAVNRSQHAAVLLTDGGVLVVGGAWTSSAEIYR